MSRNTWFTIRNAASADAPAEISIHDEIGSWGVSAKDFLAKLRGIAAATPIHLSLHSPGGEVFDGLAIYHALKARGNVTVRIEGLAASMASVIAMAGTRIEMPRNAFMMIHNPSGFAMGDAADMRQLADLLDKVKGSLIAAYRDRTKKSDEDLIAMMDAETWLTGEEAVAQGFADAATDDVALSASAFKTARITAALRHAPTALFDTAPPPTLCAPPQTMKSLLIALCSAFNIALKGDETDEAIVAKITAHKPAQNIVLNIEDAETKKIVDAAVELRITALLPAAVDKANAPLKQELEAVKTENANLSALLTNGAAAAAGGNAPIHAAPAKSKPKAEQIEDLRAQLNASKDPKERGEIIAQIRALRDQK